MKQEEEVWKRVRPFPRYEISNLGSVRNRITGYVLRPYLHSHAPAKCYLRVCLFGRNGKRKAFLAHRLVALYHVPGRSIKKKHVHHCDGQKANNVASNLMWVTPHEHKALELDRYSSALNYHDDPF